MPRGKKTTLPKAIGIRPCGIITEEMLDSKEWKEHWFNENIIAARSIGGMPISKACQYSHERNITN